jgi:curved DNA-binding protein
MPPDVSQAVDRARALLGLAPGAPLAAWRPAFNLAIKKVHPDLGGDADEAMMVLEAYRLLKAWETDRNHAASAQQFDERASRSLQITIAEAFGGVRRDVMLEYGQPFRVCLPRGLRSGDQVEFGPGGIESWRVNIASEPHREIRGSDLWIRVPLASSLLRRGGAITVDTPLGSHPLQIPRTTVTWRSRAPWPIEATTLS